MDQSGVARSHLSSSSVFDGANVDSFSRHYNFWSASLKEILRSGSTVGRLLESIPRRPTLLSTGRPLASSNFSHNPCYDMLGLLLKYNLEFRRACPKKQIKSDLDVWSKVAEATMESDWFSFFTSAQFQVPVEELRESTIWDKTDVDWTAWISSMIAPAWSGSSAASAIGDKCFYVRKVLTISFPALCVMLQQFHTATEIEQAWLRMPLVKLRKANRGSAGGRRR